VLASVIVLDCQGEVGLLFHGGSKEEYVWNTGAPLNLILSCPVIKVSGKVQLNPGRIIMTQTFQ
jgi:hypothetical protein